MKRLTQHKNTLNTKVSDLITISDILSLPSNSAVFLNVGVGGGKSHFCKNRLYNVAVAQHKRILYIINRKNPCDQFKQEIVCDQKYDCLTITTYQAIESRILSNKDPGFYQYDYIVLDEYHRFAADTVVDAYTDLILEYIYNIHCIRFFLSATPYGMDTYIQKELAQRNIYYTSYMLPACYSMMTLKLIHDPTAIKSIINTALQQQQKIIVFSNNIKMLYRLYVEYHSDALFICSEYNESYIQYVNDAQKEYMIENELLPCSILFATTCLDIGFNLNDTSIKHIVCDLDDVDQLKQCVGRRRIQGIDDTFNVYVQNQSKSTLESSIRMWQQQIQHAWYLKTYGPWAYCSHYKYNRDRDDLIFIDVDDTGDLRLRVLDLKYQYYVHRIWMCQQIINSGKSYLLYLQDEFGCKISNEVRKAGMYQFRYEYLKSIEGKELDRQDREKLCNVLSYRKDNRKLARRFELINQCLERDELPFRIYKLKNNNRCIVWIIQEIIEK